MLCIVDPGSETQFQVVEHLRCNSSDFFYLAFDQYIHVKTDTKNIHIISL